MRTDFSFDHRVGHHTLEVGARFDGAEVWPVEVFVVRGLRRRRIEPARPLMRELEARTFSEADDFVAQRRAEQRGEL